MFNLYSVFKNFLPKKPLLVGVVMSIRAGGCVVQFPNGSVINARGSATVGSSVFVRDDVIEGVAPSLSVVVIEV